MTRFEITYRDPVTGELMKHTDDFMPTDHISAREWAEDLAYSLAKKGWYEIKEVKS